MKETLARALVFILLVGGSVAIGLAYWLGETDTVILHARMPEAGGWAPSDLTVEAGHPLRLRLTSDDVVHSFAVGQSDDPPIEVYPGKVTDLALTFDQPGTYTYYCTRWCGPNHWRMRGTITVTGERETAETPEQPLYVQLGLDIDIPHEAQITPIEKPSAQRGKEWHTEVPEKYFSQEYYRAHSPEQTWQDLRVEPVLASLSSQQLWEVVAYIWQSNTTLQSFDEVQGLYATNCAACHGENGAGDGVFANEVSGSAMDSGTGQLSIEDESIPTDFTDPKYMLAASPALLQGKLIRGGMGTGMPMWGVIFTEEQTWSLVSYLYTFQFEEVR